MNVLEYYTLRKENSMQKIASLIANVNASLGDTQTYLNTYTDDINRITEIQMLTNRLNQYLSEIDIEKAKFDTLNEICLSLASEKKS